MSSIQSKLWNLGIEYRTDDRYYTKCPKCKTDRKTALSVSRNGNYINYKCMREGRCAWNESQSVKVDENDCTYLRDTHQPIAIPSSTPKAYDVYATQNIPLPPQDEIPQVKDDVIVYCYRNVNNQILFYIMRCELGEGKKAIYPLTYDFEAKRWRSKGYQGKTLYGAQYLKDHDKVIVVEGEKAADGGRKIFTKAAVVTWQGGTGGVKNGDWALLRDKEVILWPDNDAVGIEAMQKVADHICGDRMYMVDPTPYTKQLGDSYDLGDDIPLELVREIYSKRQRIIPPSITGFMNREVLFNDLSKDWRGTPYGFAAMDVEINIPNGGVVLVSGRTNHGKSLFMMNVLCNLLEGTDRKLIYYTFEMPVAYTAVRMAMVIEGTCFDPVSTKINLATYFQRFREHQLPRVEEIFVPNLGSRLFITQTGDNRTMAHDLDKSMFNGAIVFVDYGQIIPVVGTGSQRYEAIKRAIESLRDVAMKRDMGILVGSQLTAIEQNNSLMDQAREGKDLEMTAWTHLKIWNKTVAEARGVCEKTYENVRGELIVHVQKHRGLVGTKYGFDIIAGAKLREIV